MAIDAGIYGQIGQGVKSVADYDQQYAQLDAAKQAREMGALNLLMGQRTMQAQDRAAADQQALRSLVSGFGTDDAANEQALIRAGRLPEAQAYRKAAIDAAKDREEIGFKRSQTRENDDKIVGTSLQRYRDALSTIQTPDDYVRHLKAQYDDPVIGPIVQRMGGDFMTAASRIPTDPAAFQEYVKRSAMGMDKFIADQTTRANARLSADTQLTTNRLTNETSRANNQATVGATLRGQNMTDARAREANTIAAGEFGAGAAPVLGVPVPTVLPWGNQSNARDANKVKAAEATRGAKEVEKDVETATKEGGVANAARRFLELNAKVKTGGVADKFGPGRFVQSLGSDYAELEAITAKLVPGMREPGSGTTSDRDLAMFERSTVGVDKPRATNEAIARGVIARAENAQDYALFRQTYLEQNGTLQGADRYWRQYLNANPIFDPRSDAPKINPARKPWREHFAGGNAPAAAPAAAPAPAAPKAGPTVSNW